MSMSECGVCKNKENASIYINFNFNKNKLHSLFVPKFFKALTKNFTI